MTQEELKQIAEMLSIAIGTAVEAAVERAMEDTTDRLGAARAMGVSPSFIDHHIKEIPHHQIGKRNVFRKSVMREFGERYNNMKR